MYLESVRFGKICRERAGGRSRDKLSRKGKPHEQKSVSNRCHGRPVGNPGVRDPSHPGRRAKCAGRTSRHRECGAFRLTKRLSVAHAASRCACLGNRPLVCSPLGARRRVGSGSAYPAQTGAAKTRPKRGTRCGRDGEPIGQNERRSWPRKRRRCGEKTSGDANDTCSLRLRAICSLST